MTIDQRTHFCILRGALCYAHRAFDPHPNCSRLTDFPTSGTRRRGFRLALYPGVKNGRRSA